MRVKKPLVDLVETCFYHFAQLKKFANISSVEIPKISSVQKFLA